MSHFVLGVTGASGAIYAARTLWHLQKMGHSVALIQTAAGKSVAAYEEEAEALQKADSVLNIDDFFAECASGNSCFSGMAVVPCSMGSLGKIANGIADNLLTRTADVCLKERRPLVVVPREMPYNLIHIKNMERLTLAGAVVIPANPSVHFKRKTVVDVVDTVVSKILRHLNVPNQIVPEWGSAK